MAGRDAIEAQTDAAVAVVRAALADSLLAFYRFGSVETTGLRPDSDIDLLAVIGRDMTADARRRIVSGLLPLSGRETRPPSWRPLELTIVSLAAIVPWRHPPRQELQYGEWWHDELIAGEQPWPTENPDLGVLVAMAREHGRAIVGLPAHQLLPEVPTAKLRRAMLDALPDLIADLADDTRNVLLTLARMWSTAATGAFRSKDEAADWALERLPEGDRPLLVRARNLYRSGGWGSWPEDMDVQRVAARMADEIRVAGDATE